MQVLVLEMDERIAKLMNFEGCDLIAVQLTEFEGLGC